MNPSSREATLFAAALERPAAERPAFLDRAFAAWLDRYLGPVK